LLIEREESEGDRILQEVTRITDVFNDKFRSADVSAAIDTIVQ
jgi:hypothetical protein